MSKITRSVTTTTPSDAPITPTEEAVAALLSVLRSVDRQVQTTLELSTEADEAVKRFRAIALDLATGPTSALRTASGSGTLAGR